MNNTIHRGPAVLVLMMASALIAAGLVRAGGTPPKSAGASPQAHQHGSTDAPAPATGRGGRVQGTVATIVGEVMDPACYLEAGLKSIGPGHYQCALDCVRSGQTLAIYDRENDRIYFIAGELPGKNPNDPLLPYIHKRVDVHGTVYFRSGVYGIVILSVALHQDTGGGAGAPPGDKGAGK